MNDRSSGLVARIHGTGYSVVGYRGASRLAVQSRIASLYAVAEQAVVTRRIVYAVNDGISNLVARVHRAPNTVIGRRSHASLAIQSRIASLGAVAEQAIVTKSVTWRVDDGIGSLVARVHRAPNPVIGRRSHASLAIQRRIASLYAVAEQAVVTKSVTWRVDDGIGNLVARVHRAPNPVIGRRSHASLAIQRRIASLYAVAEQAVVTRRIVYAVNDRISSLVARVHRAPNPVIGRRSHASLAIQRRIASLYAVAEQAIVTKSVTRRVDDGIGSLVARIHRAPNPVIGRRSHASLAIQRRIASLGAVAELAVVTKRVVYAVNDGISSLVARIHRTPDAVISRGGRTSLAIETRIASLSAVAE